ncbi:MAG: BatA and WFA domain-containing protein [Melioribacteraceae bacterium]|nr:BatA and WFA domain-containing protein [Melioribacteraceae bacterium]
MVFLNPAFLIGLLAAAIPVLLHFLNLQKLKKIEFSTLAFLKELQKTKIRKLRFKQWLLLALRILLILLLVSVFARPTFETFTIAGTSSAKTSSVFIIDNSFSMSVVKGNGSHFNKAKEIVKTIMQDFQQGDEAAILFSSSLNEGKFTTSITDLEKNINTADISVQKYEMHDAILLANDLLKSSNNFNKELFILSDFSQKDFVDNLSSYEFKLDTNLKIYLMNFANEEIYNSGITEFNLENQLLEPGKEVSFSALIQNFKSNGNPGGVASLFINNTRSAQQSFSFDNENTKSIFLQTVLNEGGLIESFLEIEQDDITHDNVRYTAFLVPEELSVLLAADDLTDARFVKLALETSSDKRTTIIKEISNSELTFNLNSTYDVVVIIGSNNISNAEAIQKYIEDGGRVILFPGSLSDSDNIRKVFSELGIRQNITQVGSANSTESIAYFNKVEYEHPIFSDLFENENDTKVESPEVYTYFKILPSEQLFPIISLNDNSLFLSEIKQGEGRLLLFNSSPLLSWNNFPVKSLFAPLINKSMLYQTSKSDAGKHIIAGESFEIRISKLNLPQLKIVKPDKTEEFINLDEFSDQNFISYDKTDQLGVYKIYSDEELIDFVVVNFDPAESVTSYASNEEIEKVLNQLSLEDNYTFIEPSTNYKESIKQARFGTELWKYFLIAALFIALIEMFVSKNSRKDFAELKT